MRNAEEFSGQRSGLARLRPAYRRPRAGGGGRPGSGRIRYAHGGALPPGEPFAAVPQGPAGHPGSGEDAGGGGEVRDVGNVGDVGDVRAGAGPVDDDLGGRDLGGGLGGRDLGGDAWPTGFPAGSRHADLWVLVCGGIAAVAAFAAAFAASGGVVSHPAAPGSSVPAVVSQACPAPAPAPGP